MPANSIFAQCPHCAAHTAHAFLPAIANSGIIAMHPADGLGLRADQQFVCTACEHSWQAAIVPKVQLDRLRAAVAGLDEAKRQIAMMRLIMSKDQAARAESSSADIIPLRRAA